MRWAQLSITTTTIRSIVETTAHRAYNEKRLTEQQRLSISNGNGHGTRTVRDYYLLDERTKDVELARQTFEVMMDMTSPSGTSVSSSSSPLALLPADSVSSTSSPLALLPADSVSSTSSPLALLPADSVSSTSSPLALLPADSFLSSMSPFSSPIYEFRTSGHESFGTIIGTGRVRLSDLSGLPPTIISTPMSSAGSSDYGTVGLKHPDINMNCKKLRATWTQDEINYVGVWCTEYLLRRPEWAGKIVAECRNNILGNGAIRELFHPIHLASSGRLKYGYDAWKKNQNVQESKNSVDV
jgi:hypothetical protein